MFFHKNSVVNPNLSIDERVYIAYYMNNYVPIMNLTDSCPILSGQLGSWFFDALLETYTTLELLQPKN